MGPPLARPGPLRRDRRTRVRLRHRQRVSLPRLRDSRVQRRPAVRPVRDRADRRRPARVAAPAPGRGLQRVDHRHRVLLPRRGNAFAGRRPRRADAADRQPDRRDLQDVPGPHRGLCPLPRPQVRPDHQQRLLRPGRVPPQLAASAGVHRSSPADRAARSSGCEALKKTIAAAAGRSGSCEASPGGPARWRPADGLGRPGEASTRRDRLRGFQPRQLRRLVRDR